MTAMTNPPTPPPSEESPQKPMSDQWIKDFRLWTNPPIEKEAIEQGDKPFPPDPDAGYVRPHAEIHADLLKVNLENSELRRSLSDTANPGEPRTEKVSIVDADTGECVLHGRRVEAGFSLELASRAYPSAYSTIILTSETAAILSRFLAPPSSPPPTATPGEPGIEKLLDDYRDEVYSAISTARIVAARAALVGYVEELRKERDSVHRALAESDIGGIYDVFAGPADAITQMGLYVKELEARSQLASLQSLRGNES